MLILLALVATSGFDRDTLLTDAPAVPPAGTVRASGSVNGQTTTTGVTGVDQGLVGSIAWSPLDFVSADVGLYSQGTATGPTARLRVQALSAQTAFVDVSGGLRLKAIGFRPDRGEAELFVAVGRRFGAFELAGNGVLGLDSGGGTDAELKAFAGFRLNDVVRAGVDSRIQFDLGSVDDGTRDERGRAYDLVAGPALSLLFADKLEVQALVGVSQPVATSTTSPIAIVSATFDF